jgi:hypothetical protein
MEPTGGLHVPLLCAKIIKLTELVIELLKWYTTGIASLRSFPCSLIGTGGWGAKSRVEVTSTWRQDPNPTPILNLSRSQTLHLTSFAAPPGKLAMPPIELAKSRAFLPFELLGPDDHAPHHPNHHGLSLEEGPALFPHETPFL